MNRLKERRAFGRRATYTPARIVQAGGPQIDVAIVDLSGGGARLKFPADAEPPEAFLLLSEGLDLQAQCALVHKAGDTYGVRFTAAPTRLSWGRRRQHAPTGDNRCSFTEHLRSMIKLRRA